MCTWLAAIWNMWVSTGMAAGWSRDINKMQSATWKQGKEIKILNTFRQTWIEKQEQKSLQDKNNIERSYV